MKVLLLHLDGKLPNVALMRIAAHHRDCGDHVELRRAGNAEAVERRLGDEAWDRVYASAIFQWTRPVAERVREVYPQAIVGGTGWDLALRLEDVGISTKAQDYGIYPGFRQSIGFSQRGCRLRCRFCCVPQKEGAPVVNQRVPDVWRGEPWPRELILLDNDPFGVPEWRDRFEELRDGGFKVSFTQGINARMLNDETAAAMASIDYRDDGMKARRLYTAWDNRKDEARLFAGLDALTRHGVKPDHIMVYVLIGYDHARGCAVPTLTADDFHRRDRLRAYGCRPYPMPYVRTTELLGFQRWIVGAYDKAITWREWQRAGYRPERLRREQCELELAPVEHKD